MDNANVGGAATTPELELIAMNAREQCGRVLGLVAVVEVIADRVFGVAPNAQTDPPVDLGIKSAEMPSIAALHAMVQQLNSNLNTLEATIDRLRPL